MGLHGLLYLTINGHGSEQRSLSENDHGYRVQCYSVLIMKLQLTLMTVAHNLEHSRFNT
jgi:hypothetical protein